MTTVTDAPRPDLSIGSALCECATCGELFKSPHSFDKHRIATTEERRRCLSPDEMRAIGMSVNDRGFWITAVFNRPDLTA